MTAGAAMCADVDGSCTMFKVLFNDKLRARFVRREDADNFVDVLCNEANQPDTITVLDEEDKPLYGFNEKGDHWG
jgi:hypothetical protein